MYTFYSLFFEEIYSTNKILFDLADVLLKTESLCGYVLAHRDLRIYAVNTVTT